MDQDEFNSLSDAEQLRLINEQKSNIEGRMHILESFLDHMLKSAKDVLSDEKAPYDDIDVLSSLYTANKGAIPEGSVELLLAAAVMRLTKIEIENEKLPSGASRIQTEDGEAIILASLNVDETEYRVSPDTMRAWSELYSSLSGVIPGKQTNQAQTEGILFLVAEPKPKPKGMFDKSITVITGKDAGELDKLLEERGVPDEIRNLASGLLDEMNSRASAVEIPEARTPEHDQ